MSVLSVRKFMQIRKPAVIIYLAGRKRLVNKNANFVIHQCVYDMGISSIDKANDAITKMNSDNSDMMEIINRECSSSTSNTIAANMITIPLPAGDMIINATESIQKGISHGIANFAAPAGSVLINI